MNSSWPGKEREKKEPLSPIIFPLVADGGGYITHFILLSPTTASDNTLSFYAKDGTLLDLGAAQK
jgi:hypothetical protein